jgi:hypothetical protein
VQPHLRLLGILQLLWGWIGLLLGVSTLMLAAGAAAIGLASNANGLSAGATAATFAIFSAALLAAGVANAWAGASIRKRQPWGRLAALALAVPNLFVLPFGTALGVYAFWVLLHDEARRSFGITGGPTLRPGASE